MLSINNAKIILPTSKTSLQDRLTFNTLLYCCANNLFAFRTTTHEKYCHAIWSRIHSKATWQKQNIFPRFKPCQKKQKLTNNKAKRLFKGIHRKVFQNQNTDWLWILITKKYNSLEEAKISGLLENLAVSENENGFTAVNPGELGQLWFTKLKLVSLVCGIRPFGWNWMGAGW